ncbi:MAG TPA: hypothetical protein PK609_03165 [Candidatus Paceibacterota bacterium]|nr:hypothetical protein [Candidatus Paceibacterota bacterium]
MTDFGNALYRSRGVLWRTVHGIENEFIADNPLCPNSTCHTVLDNLSEGYYCTKCEKTYARKKDHSAILREVRSSWEGFQTLKQPIYSLDLPPTKVLDEDKEDGNYWVQARISEKEGKRMAVVYFGERIHGKQEKNDYVQVFLDFDDEQLRFDKNNKNPMKLLAKLSAEFPSSTTSLEKNDKSQHGQ